MSETAGPGIDIGGQRFGWQRDEIIDIKTRFVVVSIVVVLPNELDGVGKTGNGRSRLL